MSRPTFGSRPCRPARLPVPIGFFSESAFLRNVLIRIAALAALLAFIFASRGAIAGTNGTWTNTASGGLWSFGGNWKTGIVADGTDGVADFSTLNITADNTVHLDSPRTIGTLNFGDTTPSNNWTLDGNGSFSNILTLATSTGTPVIQVNNQTVTNGARLIANQGFTKTGAGTLVFTGSDYFYTGNTVINAGVLRLSASDFAIQDSTVVVNVDGGLTFGPATSYSIAGLAGANSFSLTNSGGAAIALTVGSNNASTTYSGAMTGAGSLTKGGNGVLTLSGANTYSGTTTVFAGILSLGNAMALQNSTLTFSSSAGHVQFQPGIGTFTLGGLSGGLSLTDTAGNPVNLQLGNNNSSTGTGTINGAGSLVKIGTGTLSLGLYNAAGNLTIGNGAVAIAGFSAPNSTMVVNANGGLKFIHGQGFSGTLIPLPGGPEYEIGGLSGSGSFSLSDTGGSSVELIAGSNNADSTYSGAMTGTLSGSLVAGSTLDKEGAGTLTLSGASNFPQLSVSRGTVRVTGSIANNGSASVGIARGNDFATASLVRRVQNGGSFAGYGSMTGAGTTAAFSTDIRAGQNNSGAAVDLAMQWRTPNSNDAPRVVSDVLNLTGMAATAGAHVQTDPYALQMTYNPTALGGPESVLAAEGLVNLAWLNPALNQPFGLWQNATTGNFDAGLPGDVFQNVQSSWDAFAAANSITDANVGNFLGSYGVDVADHEAWAVVNHNSQFSVVPEPGTALLLAMATLMCGVSSVRGRMWQTSG
jgi:autotransporter-associated beta strand protein